MSMSPMALTRYESAPGSFFSSLVADPDNANSRNSMNNNNANSRNSMNNNNANSRNSMNNNNANTNTNASDGNNDLNLLGRSRFFTPAGESPCLTSESSCKAADLNRNKSVELEMGPDRSYVVNEMQVGDLVMSSRGGGGRGGCGGSSSPLFRHSSSPAGFLSHLMVDNGLSVARGGGTGYSSQAASDAIHAMAPGRRLKSQLSFSSRQDSLSHISGITSDDAAQTYMASNFQIGSWDDANSIVFTPPGGKRGKDNNGDIIAAALGNIDSPTYSLSKINPLGMANVENLFKIHEQDSVPCKIRAKRGCATHPRSIAERERRTRISEKLRKLQELVPNMDKQTSTADMLDLAVQHIKGLQTHIQNLNQDRANCTCSSSKQEMS